MTNLVKIDLVELDITCKNYLSRVLDAEIHLDVMGFGDTIKHENEASNKKKRERPWKKRVENWVSYNQISPYSLEKLKRKNRLSKENYSSKSLLWLDKFMIAGFWIGKWI